MQIVYIAPVKKRDQMVATLKIKDKKTAMIKAKALLAVATIEFCRITTYATGMQKMIEKVDTKGLELFGMCQRIAFWGAVIFMVVDLVKLLRKEDPANIIRVGLRYSLWYAGIYYAPNIITFIVDMFH